MNHQRTESPILKFAPQMAVVIYFVVLAVLYARVLPLFEATDEGAHFLNVHLILETGQLPVFTGKLSDTGDANVVERWSFERHQPPLYYLLGALLVSWSEREDIENYLQTNTLIFMRNITENNHNMWLHSPESGEGDTASAAWTLRLFSIALATGTLIFIYQTALLAFGQRRIALLAMLFTASIPMFISISGSINNDNLMTFLYAVGVYWCLRMWRRAAPTEIRTSDIIILSVILTAAALTKLTGVTLFGVVYLALFIGAYRGVFTWRQVGVTVGVTLVAAGVLAGWWYLRNLSLYGDFLASKATVEFFGETPQRRSIEAIISETGRMWRTFWFGIGYLHELVYGPAWLYIYGAAITITGFVGVGLLWLKNRRSELASSKINLTYLILYFLAIFGVMVAALFAGTREIDISYGRIVFPALVAIAPLLAAGWQKLFGRWLSAVVIAPLVVLAMITPFKYLPDAYPTPQIVESLPQSATVINAQAESLILHGYEIENQSVSPDEEIRVWLYVSGQHPDNPALTVSLVDSITGNIVGTTDVYPGMASPAQFTPDTIYRVQVDVEPNPDLIRANIPRQLSLAVGWSVPFPARILQWTDSEGNTLDSMLLEGPLWIDRAYKPPAPQYPANVVYSDAIRLSGYGISPEEVSAGESVNITLHWGYVAHTDTDWTIAVGLLDTDNNVITNADSMPPGYPTSLWQSGIDFTTTHILNIPADTPAGEYRLYVGWYRLSDGERLTPIGENVEGSLFIAPIPVVVKD